ncbi:DUF3168 domain-containing protein [Nocardiopsis sp. YSL2]|uniref:DUF3168 domain-containing protein n=1 Tax=Nocardiopsis sp. YSL2 TaxID=2939492 RepID=UPI0026F416B1|nr:DUF3168 domain-containing protein [Nocardiopsis sp. YSL2]
MAVDLPPFPDIEDLLCEALADLAETGSETPHDLQDHLPWIRPTRIGGSDDRRTDVSRVDVDVFAPTRAEAWRIARAVQQRLITGPTRVIGVGLIDRARTELGPRRAPHTDQTIRRVLATYRVSARR